MSGQEFWTKLQKLGFTQVGFAAMLKLAPQTVRSWIGEKYPVPMWAAKLVNLMLKAKLTIEDLEKA
jgi:hypothetical protein